MGRSWRNGGEISPHFFNFQAMIDPKFTDEIARWLAGEHKTVQQIEAGAMLLLRLNRDKGMFQRIMRRPERQLSFLEYKLRRFLLMRQDGQTINDVIKLDSEITPQIQAAVNTESSHVDGQPETLPTPNSSLHTPNSSLYIRKGIRPDHDKLPADIQAIWPKNAERWKKIKETFEACKTLTEPCDRYEYLKILKETWYKYKKEMARYDDYKLTADGAETLHTPNSTLLTPEEEKELKNADSYISKNLSSMLALVTAAKEDDFSEAQAKNLESLRLRIQQRVDVLLKYGRSLTDERREQLLQCDIRVTTEKPEGNE